VRRGVFLKLLGVFLLVVAAATVTMDSMVRPAWENSLRRQAEQAVIDEVRLLANRVQSDHSIPLGELVAEEAAAANVRITVIDPAGRVLADSQPSGGKPDTAIQPEFAAALRGQLGTATRNTPETGVPVLYAAAPISGGAVRIAHPLLQMLAAQAQARHLLLAGSVIAFLFVLVLSAVIAHLMTQRLQHIVAFAERIARGDLSARIAQGSRDEIATVASALDRTARKLEASFAAIETSRRQLETLLNSMQEAVIAVGSDRRVLWVNGRMRQIAGSGVRIGAPLVEMLRDPSLLAAVEDAIAKKKVCVARATALLPGRTFQITAAPMPPAGAVAVLHDLSEVERVEKTRRDFIANVSHELRTPLTSVQGYAETLLDSPAADNPNTREFLDIIVKNAARMTRLTEDLLVLARVESGEQRFSLKPVNSADLLNEAAETFGLVVKDAEMELQVEASATDRVLADPEAIHQVLSNLIRNAMNYARDGGRIVIGARLREQAVEFYVRDFGRGIPSEHLSRLFERFYRVDKTRSRESGGTGLGLAIVKHIVLAHGGEVHAESRLGHGSTFYFTLPLAPADMLEPSKTTVVS
jgi:two-component system, OmpR family, phosphate regulon sensor histidine kinase PhoR